MNRWTGIFAAGTALLFKFVQQCRYILNPGLKVEATAGSKADSRPYGALAQTLDPLDLCGDPSIDDNGLQRVGNGLGTALRTRGLIAAKPAVDAD